MGHLWKRNGVWYMRYKSRRGTWRQESCRTGDRRAAKHKLDDKERRVAAGEDKPLADFLKDYLTRRSAGLGARGVERYTACKDNLIEEPSPLAKLTVQEIDVAACTKYIVWRLGHKRSRSTILKEISWLKAAIDAAAEEGYVSWERAYQIRRKKWPEFRHANRARERVLLPQEREILFDAAKGNVNLHAAMTVAFWTGLRMGNILELVEAQVDFTSEPAVIRLSPAQMKNRTGHIVNLAPAVKDLLWGMWQGVPSRRFFVDFRPALKRMLAKLEKDGKLLDFSFHDFRRGYATYRIAAGIDPKTVQWELGHRTSRMTMDTYAMALKDPAIRAWARQHFRWGTEAYVKQAHAENGENRGDAELQGMPDKSRDF